MTRNDAYKAARHIWRTEMKRGKRSSADAFKRLRLQGASPRDVEMVRAFQRGRRYPDELAMRYVETAESLN